MTRPLYPVLLVVTIACAVGGVLTLIPASGASYENVLGYRSLCTFAPAASLYCFAAAGITCILRASLVKRPSLNGGRVEFRLAPVLVVLIVMCLAVLAHLWFVSVKSTYLDATSAVTLEQ